MTLLKGASSLFRRFSHEKRSLVRPTSAGVRDTGVASQALEVQLMQIQAAV